MQRFEAEHDLGDEAPGPVLAERAEHLDERGQVAAGQVLHDKEKVVLVLCRKE